MRLPQLKLFALLLCFTNVSSAQDEIFMRVNGIDGESNVSGYERTIKLNGFVGEIISCADRSCAIQTKTIDVSFMADKAIIALRRMTYERDFSQKVEIMYTRNGANGLMEYYKITMEEVFITRIAEGGTADSQPEFQVHFSPSKIGWTYTSFTPDGRPNTPQKFGWDISKNLPWSTF